jgi:twitching motility protein PilI
MSTVSPESASLKALRDQPYELLAELERRGRNATASPETTAEAGSEWVGVAVRMAGEIYLVAREEAREVLGVPAPLTRVPGARGWLLGLASLRGQLFPVIDLRLFLGGGATPASRTTRIVVANHRDVPAALWSTRCSASGASPRRASTPRCRPRSCPARASWPARSCTRACSCRC